MPQVLGEHVSGILVSRYPDDVYSLLFYQIAHIVEPHIDVFRLWGLLTQG